MPKSNTSTIPTWRIALVAAFVSLLAIALPEQPQFAVAAGVVGLCLAAALQPGAGQEWFEQTWGFAKLILPLLLAGVLLAGLTLGRPGQEGLIPSAWVAAAVGGNSLTSNAFAAVAGAFMYFATLTEIPITQALLGIEGDKPLDCVGDIKESRAAMRLAFEQYPELKDKYHFDIPEDYDFRAISTHEMPDELYRVLLKV